MKETLLKRAIPHVCSRSGCYITQSNNILKFDYKTEKLIPIASVVSNPHSLKSKLKEGLLRNRVYLNYLNTDFGVHHVSIINDQHLIAIYDSLYYLDLTTPSKKLTRVSKYKEMKISNPLFGGIAAHPLSNCFYFGEYIHRKREVRIIKFNAITKDINVAYTFELGTVRHVHGIFYDEYRNRLWVTTGDRDSECKILYTDDEFENLQTFGGGDQSWRAVSLIIDESGIFYGTDAGKDADAQDINKLFFCNVHSKERTELATIGNPSYHSCKTTANDYYFGVNFEPGRKQNTEKACSIWKGNINNPTNVSKIESYKYQLGKTSGCSKYGYIYLPKGTQHANHIFFAALNTENLPYATFRLID